MFVPRYLALNKQSYTLIRLLIARFVVARVSARKIDIAEHADILGTIKKTKSQGRQTTRSDALFTVIGMDVYALQIDRVWRFGDDVSLEDQLAVLKDRENTALFDAAGNSLEKAFAVFQHWVNTAFDKCDLGLSLCYWNELT